MHRFHISYKSHTYREHSSGRIFIKCTAIHIFRALKKRGQKRKNEMHEDLHRCMGYPKWIHKVTKRYVALYSNWHFNFIQFVPHFTILCTLDTNIVRVIEIWSRLTLVHELHRDSHTYREKIARHTIELIGPILDQTSRVKYWRCEIAASDLRVCWIH